MSASADSGTRPPAGRLIARRRNAVEVVAVLVVEPHDQVELPLALNDFGNGAAVQGRFDELVDVVRPSGRAGPAARGLSWICSCGISTCCSTIRSVTPGTSSDRRLDLLGRAAEHGQIVAVELDADLGLDAREHVRNQMLQRLLGGDDDAGHLGQLVRGGRQASPRGVRSEFGIEADDDLRNVDAFGMLVELGPAGAAAEAGDARAPCAIRSSTMAAMSIRRFQRRARRQQHVDLHAAFVERRQEIAAQVASPTNTLTPTASSDGAQNRPRMAHAEANRAAGEPLQQPQAAGRPARAP